jgi:TonB-dependent SusC/RagA subfamily outer membrane receptor
MRQIMLFLALLFFIPASSQRRPAGKFNRPMQLKKCSISVKADHFTATTYIEMEFYNPGDEEIEGLHTFSLQPGQAITAFQLDLNGKFRDGSIEERWKATNAYNTIVGKRIDPALLSMTYYNHYTLNIYPIAPKSSRRVSMTIQQLMKSKDGTSEYLLPLNITDTVEEFKADIFVNKSPSKPVFRPGLLNGRFSSGANDHHEFRHSSRNTVLNKPIAFSLFEPKEPVFCTKQVGSLTYFALKYQPVVNKEYNISPKKITVFWDVSASGKKRDIEKEISFLRQYVSFYQVSTMTVIPFNHQIRDTVTFHLQAARLSDWARYLRSLTYDGATQLGVISLENERSDAILLFTDGQNSYGKNLPKPGKAFVYCISSANTNDAHLRKITEVTGGEVIDLSKIKISEGMEMMGKARNMLMEIRSSSGKTIIDRSVLEQSGQISLAGTLWGGSDTMIFNYGNNNHVNESARVFIDGHLSCPSSAIDRMDALMEFERIMGRPIWHEMLGFGKREKIVTTNTSFIVLERIEDYVTFNIEPPKEIEEECIRQGYVKKDISTEIKKFTAGDVLRGVVAFHNMRLSKWDQNAPPISLENVLVASRQMEQNSASSASQLPVGGNEPKADMSEVVVTAYGIQRQRHSLSYSVTASRSDILTGRGFTSVEQALQGRVAGLNVISGSQGALGNVALQIRGLGSLSNGSNPLIILDGVPVYGNINDLVSLNDIDNITVLKDASAAALYGSRGANGVLVINTKRGRDYGQYYYPPRPYKLKNMEDVEYLQDLKAAAGMEKLNLYRELQETYGNEPGFYMDAAMHLYESGYKAEALTALSNAAEVSHGSVAVLKATAFLLEEWKEYDEAIRLLESLKETEGNIWIYRSLAWVHYRKGDYQEAANLLNQAVTMDWGADETPNLPYKSFLLNELSAMIAMQGQNIDQSAMNKALVTPMPVDLRIVVESNNQIIRSFCVVAPTGEVCDDAYRPASSDFPFDNAYTSEYQAKQAKKGKYRLRVNFYDHHYSGINIPDVIRISVYKNFGKPNQQVEIRHVMMDNQKGIVEIGEVSWE